MILLDLHSYSCVKWSAFAQTYRYDFESSDQAWIIYCLLR